MPKKKNKANKSCEIDLLARAIEELINAKMNHDKSYSLIYQARADIKEAIAILLDVEYN